MASDHEYFIGYLCRAWGESDMPCAEFARDFEGVSRFMVREWLGEEDATDYDGAPTIPRLMAEWKDHDWEEDALWSAEFEIGGVSVERMVCHTLTPLASHTGEAEPEGACQEDDGCPTEKAVLQRFWRANRATPPATPVAPGEVADAMVDAYLKANDAYWVRTDELPKSGVKWRNGSPREATREGLIAALSHPAPVAAPASVPQAIDQLVSTLAESKGWMRDYARALIEDAIDRRGLDVAAPAPASEAVAWEAASERYLADIIDRAPEPLRRLGEWLSLKLDEDDWKTAERYVLGAMESIATPSTGGGK